MCFGQIFLELFFNHKHEKICKYSLFPFQQLQPVMSDEGYVVRIRGLPWSCSVDEVQRFFSGMCLLTTTPDKCGK